jgi:pimeloyl-ACP methyl ester carboxylesterase
MWRNAMRQGSAVLHNPRTRLAFRLQLLLHRDVQNHHFGGELVVDGHVREEPTMIAARLTSAARHVQQTGLLRSITQALDGALDRELPLSPAIDADRHQIATSDAGTISYYADTSASGRPLVLLHGVHAAASSYDMKPLFDAFRGQRPVYALDLPGFGFSERAARAYTPATYVHAIEHMLRNVSTREPVDVVALSLTSEYLAKVAIEMPELVRSLVLISPTGFAAERERGMLERLSRTSKRMLPQELLQSLPSRALYELIVSRPSLRYFLSKSFEGPIDAGMLEHTFETSHQPGAHRAPMSFLAGALFPRGDALSVYAHVHAPALVLYDQDNYTGFGALSAFMSSHANYRAERIRPTRGLPQFDAPEQTTDKMRLFFEDLDLTRATREARHTFGSRVVGSA